MGSLAGRSEKTVAHFLTHYLRSVGERATCDWMDDGGTLLGSQEVASLVASFQNADHPFILSYWIDEVLTVATLGFVDPVFEGFVRAFRCLVDDTFGGRVGGHYIEGIGGSFTLLPVGRDPERLRQVGRVLRERGSYAFPIDGGGPYGEVGTGLIGLAGALGASIVPVAAHASRGVALPHRSRVRLPLPGARFRVAIGVGVPIDRGTDRREAAATLKRVLQRLGMLARGVSLV